jgi:WD40 repeat protein
MKRMNIVNTRQGSVSQLSFVDDTDDVVTSGRDGRLIRWTPSGTATLIAQLDQPIDVFTLLPKSSTRAPGSVVFSSFDGALWHKSPDTQPVLIKRGRSRVIRLFSLPKQRIVLSGNAAGEVTAINTESWHYSTILQASGAVRNVSATPDGRRIVVDTNDGLSHVGTIHDGESGVIEVTWRNLMIRARHHAITKDGLLVAVCSDGTIWLYSIQGRRWLCLSIGNADFRWVATSAGGDAAAALDVEGRLIWVDLDAARKLLINTRQTPA